MVPGGGGSGAWWRWWYLVVVVVHVAVVPCGGGGEGRVAVVVGGCGGVGGWDVGGWASGLQRTHKVSEFRPGSDPQLHPKGVAPISEPGKVGVPECGKRA